MDLIRLVDGESGLEVKVLGRTMPGVLTLHDYLDAEIVVTSGFAQGVSMCVWLRTTWTTGHGPAGARSRAECRLDG
ncbi:DUF5959 family protein [Streptomyces sp. NRRL F-5122]|uniref:DUF5959 family protein n=1 Tax=Streptomyces sp. NRRL F-5122 TaxID=1609098 RepID=UPI001F26FAF7|nr:DUF5959 family protein [Streptomyces sp. NRRL F-5122]